MVNRVHSSRLGEMTDVATRDGAKARKLGVWYLALVLLTVVLGVVLYFLVPAKTESSRLILPILVVLFFGVPFVLEALFWFLTADQKAWFIRAGAEGLAVRFPKDRFFMLLGYRVQEATLPWDEIRDISAALSLSMFVRIESNLLIQTLDNQVLSISSCYFREDRDVIAKTLNERLAQAEADRRGEQRLARKAHAANANGKEATPKQKTRTERCRAELTKSGWLRRVFVITTPHGTFTLEWNGRRMGSESYPVVVDGRTQQLPESHSEYGRRYAFRYRKMTGYIDLQTSMLMSLKAVYVWLDDQLLYSEE